MNYDIVIIGSGPAGYVAAIRAGQLGKKVAIVEKKAIGGMCLNWGCIPSKSMIESAKLYRRIKQEGEKFGIGGIDKNALLFDYAKAQQRAASIVRRLSKGVEFLLAKNKVEIIRDEAEIVDKNSVLVDNRLLNTENIIISTGSHLKNLTDSTKEVNIIKFYELSSLPEKIVIYGYDAPSIEMCQMLAMIDKKVTLIVPNANIMPLSDAYTRQYAEKMLKKYGVEIIFDENQKAIFGNKKIEIEGKSIDYELLVNLSTRKGTIPKTKVEIEVEDGFIKTDELFRTSVKSIYAIGDVNGKSRFAHIASAQGLFVVNTICGVEASFELKKYPLNMYTYPEFSQIGLTEDDLKQQQIDYKVSDFSLTANGKAMAEGNNDGFIRILSDTKYGEVLGVQIVAANATDLIGEAAAFMELEATVYDIAKLIHAHPTISEAFMEAGLDAFDESIHS